MKALKPIPYELNPWSEQQVLYRCPSCFCDMRILGREQNYCYKCGQKLDWSGCAEHVSQSTVAKCKDLEKIERLGEISFEEMKVRRIELLIRAAQFNKEDKKNESS